MPLLLAGLAEKPSALHFSVPNFGIGFVTKT